MVTPQNLYAPINSSYDDFALAWMPGTIYGMFSSDRPGGIGWDDIYGFKKLPEPPAPVLPEQLPVIISGIVKDKTTMLPLAGATIFVLNEQTGEVLVLKADDKGAYTLTIPAPQNLLVKAASQSYIPDCLTLSADKLIAGQSGNISRDLLLDKLAESKTFKLENIYYDFDKSDIRPDAEPPLDNLVRIMKDNPITVELASHTDCRGSFKYNDGLSQRRAEAAVNYIVNQGIDAQRIKAKGYGEYQLTNRCADGVECSEAEHQANRRTEFKVTSTATVTPVSTFDPGKYKTGDKLNRDTLPADFFMNCK